MIQGHKQARASKHPVRIAQIREFYLTYIGPATPSAIHHTVHSAAQTSISPPIRHNLTCHAPARCLSVPENADLPELRPWVLLWAGFRSKRAFGDKYGMSSLSRLCL